MSRPNATDVDGRRPLRRRSTDGTPIAVWARATARRSCMVHGSIADHTTFEPLVRRAPRPRHHLLDGPPRLRRQRRRRRLRHRTRLRGRRRRRRRSGRPHGRARSRCGATPTAPTARWVAPPSPRMSTTSSSTSRASASATHRASIDASRRRSPAATTRPPSSAVLADILEHDRRGDRRRTGRARCGRSASPPTPTIPQRVPRRGELGVPHPDSSTRSPRRRCC